MGSLEIEDFVDDTFKERFLAFNKSARSLTSIRDRLNEDLTDMVSNRSIKQLIIELYDAICCTYPNNKRKSQMLTVLQKPWWNPREFHLCNN